VCTSCGVYLESEQGKVRGVGFEITCMTAIYTRRDGVRYDPAPEVVVPDHVLCLKCAKKILAEVDILIKRTLC
jgi:hypothetical protein